MQLKDSYLQSITTGGFIHQLPLSLLQDSLTSIFDLCRAFHVSKNMLDRPRCWLLYHEVDRIEADQIRKGHCKSCICNLYLESGSASTAGTMLS